jgi:threonine dehydrogenase-like Zn-dependent dehydrogenase
VIDWEEILQMIRKNEIDPTIMVTHRLRIEDIAKAYYLQENRENGLVKCFVETDFSEPRAAGTPQLKRI